MAAPRTSPALYPEIAQKNKNTTYWADGLPRSSPAWFVVGAALLYATGLLIVFTFLGAYGIHEFGSDVLKVKYIYIGALFAALPAAICGSASVLSDLCELRSIPLEEEPAPPRILSFPEHPISLADEVIGAAIENSAHSDTFLRRNLVGDSALQQLPSPVDRPRAVSTPAILLVLNFVAAIYLVVCFAPAQYFVEHNFWAFFVLCATLFGLYVPSAIEKAFTLDVVAKIAEILSWVSLAVVMAADAMLFREAEFMADVAISPAWVFLLFVLVLAYLARRILIADHKVAREPREAQAVHLWLFGAAYFLSAICFAYTVYPYIPSSRGGGDFTKTKSVVLYFKPDLKNVPAALLQEPPARPVAPQQIPPKHGSTQVTPPIAKPQSPEPSPLLVSRHLVVIDETAGILFIADPQENGGPSAWRLGDKPKVRAVRRDDLTAVEYQN